MPLGCNGTFNDQFITRSLLSPNEKKMKIGQHLPKLWAIKSFFMKHGVYSLKPFSELSMHLHSAELNVSIYRDYSNHINFSGEP